MARLCARDLDGLGVPVLASDCKVDGEQLRAVLVRSFRVGLYVWRQTKNESDLVSQY